MGISEKTRKILWTRSGNKCAICKQNLVNANNTIIGNECHIISSRIHGPRYKLIQNFDYDSFDNLLLLCSNCHKTIDTEIGYYTVEILKDKKNIHENEIKVLSENKKPNDLFPQINGITLLPIITTGKELFNILDGSAMMKYDFENTTDQVEIEFIAGMMEDLTEYMDYFATETLPLLKLKSIVNLNNILTEIKNKSFMLFGEKKNKTWGFGDNSTKHLMTAVIYLLKNDNKQIVMPNR